MTERYPAEIFPQPVACYSVEKLANFAGAPIAVAKSGGAQIAIPFDGDTLDQAELTSFLTGEPYGKITFVNNQVISASNNLVVTGGVEPPHIIPAYKIGASAAMLFEGGTNEGQQFGLEIANALDAMNIRDGNWTVIAVIRPTMSRYCNQNVLGYGEEGGTILSLEASPIINATGSVTPGSTTITGVTPFAGIAVGQLITSATSLFPPLNDMRSHVVQITPTGPSTANIVFQNGGVIEVNPAAQLTFSNPLARCYQSGGQNPGGFAISNGQFFGGDVRYEPSEFSGAEIQPIVLSFTNRKAAASGDVPGFKIWQNEIIRSAPLIAARTDLVTTGFIGRMGGSVGTKYTQCGDFWLAALLIYNVALTQAQRAIVTDSLAARFGINERRSTRQAKSITAMGDSIAAEYVTKANYGWMKRTADKFPDEHRFLNYSIPGSNILELFPGFAASNYTEGLFPLSVAAHLDYSKQKNVFILFGGGNDLTSIVVHQCEFDITNNVIRVFNEKQTSASAAAGAQILQFVDLPPTLVIGALVENMTTPASIPAGSTVLAMTANTVTLSAPIVAPGVGNGDTIRFRYHGGMAAEKRLQFTVIPPLVTGPSVGPIYWVNTVTAIDRYTISATRGGPVIDIAGAAAPGSVGTVWQYTKSATEIFGTPTTHGLQKLVADAAAAAPGCKIYMFTVLPRVGIQYVGVIDELNTLIKGGGAGGYQPIDVASEPTLANHNIPPGTIGPGYRDAVHLNEVGSQALADFFYPTLNAYLSS